LSWRQKNSFPPQLVKNKHFNESTFERGTAKINQKY
jgi:hypothetical protein